jgi:outer membrane protein assembly factor BamB
MLVTTVGMRGPVLGVKLGEAGATAPAEIRWKHSEGTPDSPSPVAWGDLVFIVNDGGIATCLDAATGKLHWKQRLDGSYRASPIAAEGRIYFLSMSGLATVIAAGSNFEKLATSEIQDEFIASPAVSDGKIYLRGRKALHVAEKR